MSRESGAIQFITGTRDFHYCDEVMNTFISDIIDLSMHADMPKPAFSIYQAFDAGEYWHTGDDRDVFPWEKWTRPELERILCEIDDGANGLSKWVRLEPPKCCYWPKAVLSPQPPQTESQKIWGIFL